MGAAGERFAERYLQAQGFRLVERNWRCHAGEVDLVAIEGDTVVLVEVKTRSSGANGHPFEALTPTKLARLYRLGAIWMAEHRVRGRYRIDAVAVTLASAGAPHIEHLRDVSG